MYENRKASRPGREAFFPDLTGFNQSPHSAGLQPFLTAINYVNGHN